jgi:hypothetical protein
MIYAEAAYFDGNHCQHVADYHEARRLARIRAESRRLIERRRNGRAMFNR